MIILKLTTLVVNEFNDFLLVQEEALRNNDMMQFPKNIELSSSTILYLYDLHTKYKNRPQSGFVKFMVEKAFEERFPEEKDMFNNEAIKDESPIINTLKVLFILWEDCLITHSLMVEKKENIKEIKEQIEVEKHVFGLIMNAINTRKWDRDDSVKSMDKTFMNVRNQNSIHILPV